MWGVSQMIHKKITVLQVSQLIMFVILFELYHSYSLKLTVMYACTFVSVVMVYHMCVVASKYCWNHFISEKY